MPFALLAHWDRLTDAERAAVLLVFAPRVDRFGDVDWIRRDDRSIKNNEAARANKALNKLARVPVLVRSRKHKDKRVPLPKSPATGALRTWHLFRRRKDRWPCEALAAVGLPVFAYLKETRSTDASRKRLVLDLAEQVDQFKRDAPRWWFDWCLSSALTDRIVALLEASESQKSRIR
jgi:hypothetical protein